jgi:hypothetical protein
VAGNSTQILVDGLEILVSHVLKIWPRHDLQELTVEWERDAAGVQGACASRMQVIHINASPDDLIELGVRVAPFGQSGFVRRQVWIFTLLS